ncbi:MAG: DUF3291 domain-containing protein [Pseudomonadota bacterium]
MHLAQLNIGEILYPMDDPRMAGFAGRLAAINALAERSEGFVWRLEDEGELDGATDLRLPGASDTLVNMSVWTGVEALYRYVYLTAHAKVMKDRKQWFVPLKQRHLVLWWVAAGHVPTLEEAADRLVRLEANGPAPAAFDFAIPFDETGQPISLPSIKKLCA